MSKFDIVRQPGDGFMIRISTEDFSWDVTFPSGRHERGRADTLEKAEAAVQAIRTQFILGQWEKGSPFHGRWSCPLS